MLSVKLFLQIIDILIAKNFFVKLEMCSFKIIQIFCLSLLTKKL